MEKSISCGPFNPKQAASCLYAYHLDEMTLFLPLDALPPSQRMQRDFFLNFMLAFQLLTVIYGKPGDHCCLFDYCDSPAGEKMLDWYYACLEQLKIPHISRENLHFLPIDTYYEEALRLAPLAELLVIAGVGHESSQLFPDPTGTLALAQRLNAKASFVEMAKANNLPIPPSLVTTTRDLDQHQVQAFIAEYAPELLIKLPGNGGALNVKPCTNLDQIKAQVAEFAAGTTLVIQQKLDLNEYQECTVDFVVTEDGPVIDNFREVIVVNGEWKGNHIRQDKDFSPEIKDMLLQCANWLHQNGYRHKHGLVCGVDFLQHKESGAIVLLETNVRFTGGHIQYHLMSKLGLPQDMSGFSFLGLISENKLAEAQRFIEQNLPGKKQEENFAVFPLGISPAMLPIEGKDYYPAMLLSLIHI